mgnify:CR=1 FL=1
MCLPRGSRLSRLLYHNCAGGNSRKSKKIVNLLPKSRIDGPPGKAYNKRQEQIQQERGRFFGNRRDHRASSGLGKEYINAIIAEYPTVDVFWLVARRKELLKEIADEHPDKTIAAISLDLSQQESLEIFEKLLKENEPEIKVLVNNAGFGKCGDFFTSNRASQMGMVDVNCRALTAITRLCLPYMLDDSLVINVASIAAFAPTPRMTVYCATKAMYPPFPKRFTRSCGPGAFGCAPCAPAPWTRPLERGGRTRGEIPPD